jgi:hypothetical protein
LAESFAAIIGSFVGSSLEASAVLSVSMISASLLRVLDLVLRVLDCGSPGP